MLKLVNYDDSFYKQMINLKVFDDQVSFIEDMPSTIKDYCNNAYGIDWVILMIFDDDTLIGYVMYGLNEANEIWIDRFLIDKNYQHQGLGKKSFKAVLDHLSQNHKGFKTIALSVDHKNIVATLFYKSFGFNLTNKFDGTEPVYIKEIA